MVSLSSQFIFSYFIIYLNHCKSFLRGLLASTLRPWRPCTTLLPSDYFSVKMACHCLSFTLLHSSVQPLQDWPLFMLLEPHLLLLLASDFASTTMTACSFQDRVGKVVFVCLLSFVFASVPLLILFPPQDRPFPLITYCPKKDSLKKDSFWISFSSLAPGMKTGTL